MKQPSMDKILEYGLISEFSYLTLESEYFQLENTKDGIIFYNNKNIEKYLQATEEEIETKLGSSNIIIPEEDQSFIEKVQTKIPFYNKDFYESVHKYRDINKDRVTKMEDINKRYEVLEFMSDSKTDLQIMLLRNKQSGQYVITPRGTASGIDIKVDSDMAVNFNPQYQPAIEFTINMMNKYEIDVNNLVFAGHSLGGTTSNMLGVTVGADAYSYNPFGAYNIYTKNPYKHVDSLYSGAYANIDLEKAKEHLFIISYQDTGNINGDILSNAATNLKGNKHVGTVIQIQGEDVGLGAGHSIVTLNKTINNLYNKNKEVIVINEENQDNLKLFNSLQKIGIDTIKAGQNEYSIKKSEVTISDENGNVLSYIPLKPGQTISHIAQKTPYNSIELLEYNNLTLEEAKSSPIGYKVLVPKEPPLEIEGEYGTIKLFKNHDDTFTLRVPDENGNKTNITYSENSDLLIYGDRTNPYKVTFSQDGKYELWEKDSKGVMYQKEVSTEEFEISYKMQDGKKVLEKIEIKKDNVEIEKFAKYTDYSKEELKEFNHLKSDTVSKNTNFQAPVSKQEIEGGYGKIAQYTTQDGNHIFIVPNKDGSKVSYATFTDGFNKKGAYEINSDGSVYVNFEDRVIIANKDGYYFDSYGFEDKVDISYKRLENGNLEVSSFVAKQDINLNSFDNTNLKKEDIAFVNSLDNSGKILAGQSLILPKGDAKYIPSAYGTVKLMQTQDGNYVAEVPNEDGTTSKYFTTKDLVYEHNLDTNEQTISIQKDTEVRQIAWNDVGRTAINQIGSLIIANNSDFSNIDKIVVGTSVGVVADLATYNNDIAVDDVGAFSWKNLAGSVVSFALSSYFAKNDNISDILGMDGTFIGELADFTVSYAVSTAVTNFATGQTINFDFYSAIGGFIGSKIGYAIADSWIDTKEESMGASIGSAIGAMAGAKIGVQMGSWGGPIGALIGAIIGVIVGSLLGGLFGGTPPPPTAEAKLEFDEETQTYNLVFSDKDDGGNEEAMIDIGNSFAKQLTNIFNLPGGQLVDGSLMPDINISQFKKKIFINGFKGSFSTAKETMAQALSVEIPFINVENGNAYVLRAMHRTNEKFLEGDPDAQSGRADLDLLYKNIKIAQEYSDYKNEVNIIIDSNGKIITDKKILQEINEEYLQISKLEDKTQKDKLLDEFSKKYSFKNYKIYVDEILKEVTNEDIQNYYIQKEPLEKSFDEKLGKLNKRLKKLFNLQKLKNIYKEEIALIKEQINQINEEKASTILEFNNKYYKEIEAIHWQEVFAVAEELRLEEQHYSEDFNKLNSEIAKYNYEIHKENNELLDVDINSYLKQIAKKMLEIYNKEDEVTTSELSKKEALEILKELGYDFKLGYLNYTNSLAVNEQISSYEEFLKNPKALKYSFVKKVEIFAKRFEELLELANISNPYENFTINEDAFSFAGKSLNDLQFELKEGKLIITTFDKDLEPQKAQESSKEFVISNWEKWDKINTHIDLPNGTKVNLQALLELIKVKENGGKVDVNKAFKTLLLEDEALAKYVNEFENKNIYFDTSLDDKITAYYGDNLIVSLKGNDTIVTGSGNDYIIVQEGKKNIDTGLGNDTVSYEKSKSGVYASLNSDDNSDTLKNVENLIGSKFDDILIGDDKDNTLMGNSGNDILEGKGGSDTLDGGEGIDLVDYINSKNSVVVNLKNNYSNKNDKYINIEGVKGSKNDDVIVTNDENNIVFANDGADNISLGKGKNIVYAGKGDDYIISKDGNNKVYTGEGDDVVILGEGNDYINTNAGKNIIYAGAGKDIVEYKEDFENYEIMFLNNNTILIKSNDKKVLDTLVDIEELAFKNAVFEVDYLNKQLIKKAEFKKEEEIVEQENVSNENNPTSQASSIATAIMIGTVAAAETKESSSDKISYLSDDPASLKELETTLSKEKVIVNNIVENNSSLYKDILLIKEYKNSELLNTKNIEEPNTNISKNINETPTKITNPLDKNTSTNESDFKNILKHKEIVQAIIVNEQESLQEEKIVVPEPKKLDALISSLVKLNKTIIKEDEIFFDFDISNPNADSSLEVIFEGLPEGFNLSNGEKRVDGNWYLTQNDLVNLSLIPQKDNSDDFTISIKAIVRDTNGRIITTQISEKLTIIAVADTPTLEVKEAQGDEDTAIPLDIKSSLVDTDGSEVLSIKIENIPNEATLNKGEKDKFGIWHLTSKDLIDLKLTPQENNSDDFTIKVTAITKENENNDIAQISKELKVIVNAVADTPTLEVKEAQGDEDTAITLDIKSSLVDTDGSEVLSIKIENIPNEATLNKGEKDKFGIWHLTSKDLIDLKLTPQENNSDDFTIKVTAITKENENNDIAQISKELKVIVNAVADTPNLSLEDNEKEILEDTILPINIKSSLVDTLDGVDGKERLLISLENIPKEATLNKGKKDSEGIWYLTKEQLEGLELTTKLHSDEDFTIKVTAYAIESENNSIASISEELKVKVTAVADTPTLEVKEAQGDEDTAITLDIKTALVDTDGSEVLSIKIENVPNEATLNKGEKDKNGVWHLKPKDLNFLTITPKAHDGTDFTIKVIALTKEKSNGHTSEILKELEVKVDAVADKVELNLFQETTSGQDGVVIVTEDPGFAYIDIASKFIDKDGSESLYYLIEGLPKGTSLTAGEKQSDGSWKLLPTQLEELSINLVENSDEDFTLKVTAVTTEKENGHQEFTSKDLEVRIESEADFANLEVKDTKGYKNSFINLDIKSSLTDIDGSETLEIVIEQVPTNAVLSKGTKDSEGKWHLTVEQLEGLQIRPEFNSIKDFELKVKAITTEKKNGHQEENIAYIKVDVQDIPSSVNINVKPVKVNEDEVAQLEISANTKNLKPSQDFYLELKIPQEFSLNTGEKLNATTWKITTKELVDLKLYSPLNYAGNFNIGITSVIIEPNKTLTKSQIEVNLPVEITPVADESILEVNNIIANEDDLIFLNLSSKLQDLDGSEKLKLEIQGIPNSVQLNAGEKKADTWIIEEKDIKKLAFIAPENFSGTLNLQIKAISEDGSSKAEVSKNLSITINEILDKPILKVQNSFIKDNEAFINIDSSLIDNDGSETLSLIINNLPQGSSLNNGVLNSDGSYTLTKQDLEGLKIKEISSSEDISLNVKAISSANGVSQIVQKNIQLSPLAEDLPYFNINKVQLNCDTSSSQTLSYSGANDTINSGGGNDKIYSNDGNDIIYSDKIGGNTKALIVLNIDKSSLSSDELIILKIDNLPSSATSDKGVFKDGSLYINTKDFDGKLLFTYPSTDNENLKLKIVANIVNEEDINTILKSSSLDIYLENSEIAGNDYIDSSKGDDTIYAGKGNDIILGKEGDDIIFAGEGDDYIEGGKGADRIDAGSGNDTIVVDYEDFKSENLLVEVLNGGEGFDTVIVDGNKGINFDMGLTNVEKFIGSEGNDNIIGSEGNDIIRGNKGVDTYFAKGGDDIAYIDASDLKSQSGDFIDMGSGYDKIYIDDTQDIVFDVTSTNAEEIILGSGNSIIKNNANSEITILGGKGNDTIYASSGKDILDGGEGIDTIDYSNSNQGININLSTNSVSKGYGTGDVISNFENVVGTSYDDKIVGNNQANIFYATKGNDTIDGQAGNDTVVYQGKLIEYFNGKEVKNITTNFNSSATVITQTGINELKNISTLKFDDYKVYLDDIKKNSAFVFDDKVFATEDTVLKISSQNLLSNDFSIKANDTLKIVGIKNSLNGTTTLNKDGTINFNPDKNYNSSVDNTFDRNSALYKGKAGFEYIVQDKDGNKSSAFVEVNVNPVNDAPTLISSYFNRNSRNTGKGKFVVDDVDSNVDALSVSVASSLAFVTSFYRGIKNYGKLYSKNVTGATNINGRTVEADGEFYFNYSGSYWKKKGDRVFEMKNFIVKISDEGDFLTGENIKSLFVHTGINFQYIKRDPIVLDLDGDGVEFVQKYYEKHNEVLDGVGKDDAVLVWDYDKDGTISSQLETDWTLLVEDAINDMDVLREKFDSNKDGVFDKNDKEWENFALWQDKNEDGVVSKDEFTKIENSNIEKINLLNTSKSQEELIDEVGTYTTKDGKVNEIAASYIDTTITEDKLSSEDKLILKQAIKLTEELASQSNISVESMVAENFSTEYEIINENEIF